MLLQTIAGAVQTWLLFAMAVLAGVLALLALVRVLRQRPARNQEKDEIEQDVEAKIEEKND